MLVMIIAASMNKIGRIAFLTFILIIVFRRQIKLIINTISMNVNRTCYCH